MTEYGPQKVRMSSIDDLLSLSPPMSTYVAGDLTTPVKTVTFGYDAPGRITGYDDGTTSGSYTYDDLGRKISEPVDYGAFTKILTTQYYANGLKRSFALPGSDPVSYAYDENNRLAAHWNRPAAVLRPGGGAASYQYDPLMQVVSMVAKDPAAYPANPELN
jgi:YD repeat-containing protein